MGNKDDMQILVVPTSVLLPEGRMFQGFQAHGEFDYEALILAEMLAMRRGDAEVDLDHKQPIGYACVVNPEKGLVFVYQRSTDPEHYHEGRLSGKLSIGVGGHIEPSDAAQMAQDSSHNPLYASTVREVTDEEIDIRGDWDIRRFGYINDHGDAVGEVHFGIAYLVETDATEVHPKDAEMSRGMFLTIPELEKMVAGDEAELEGWSQILLPAVKQYLEGYHGSSVDLSPPRTRPVC